MSPVDLDPDTEAEECGGAGKEEPQPDIELRVRVHKDVNFFFTLVPAM